ncbi:MAG: PorT family protein [Proteiniphilum sp.]|nr:PorT family protein [Proteiniphilum sp.]
MKRFFLLLVLLTIYAALHAQKQTFKDELYLGAGGGAMFTSVDFMPTVQQMFNTGVYGGIAAKYISEKHLGLVGEINFAQRGWKEEFDPATDFSYKRTLNYIEVPFMTHVYFGNKARFILNAGPQISILIGDKQEMSQALADDLATRQAADPDAPIGVQYGFTGEMSRVDYGLVGGVGMALKTAIGDFDLEGRYYFGLGDLFNSRRSDDAYFSRSAHRLIEAKLTYYLKIH